MRSGGGSAPGVGIEYQAHVAAWVAVRILAEQDAAPLWDLTQQPQPTFPVSVWCESDEPVDDVNIETSTGGWVLIQAKHGLSAETAEDSDFASALEQFVRQYHRGVPEREGGSCAAHLPVG
jgi:hypothetical protein